MIKYKKVQILNKVRSRFKGECPCGLCKRFFVRTFYRIYRVFYSSLCDYEVFCDIVTVSDPMQIDLNFNFRYNRCK